ncbi:jg18629 [Pararge aegeria aegeria]|uniref:Jg18629 protein n=1 Tax=Pararge aegeria aegeria TaxID=348720 RepID=A0A8S4QYR7_9NEOP|nr:jg18629 [Pararge aegeria aegeria]
MSNFTVRLRSFAEKLKPVPTSRHNKHKVFVFKELANTEYVFLREDASRAPFQPSYTGPHKVIGRGDKTFTLLIKGKTVTVSIDRLKPAYILSDEEDLTSDSSPSDTPPSPTTYVAPKTTRSG